MTHKTCYVELTPEFNEQYNGYKSGCNIFNTAVAIDGRIVCSINSLNEFPEIFISLPVEDLTPIWLSQTDFPLPEEIE